MQLGLGFMRHGNQIESQKIVDYAMSHNITYFETCYFYLENKCEEYVYNLLTKYPREKYQICGKMPIKHFVSSHNFKTIYKEQLNKVPGHYFDYYLLQAVDCYCLYDIFSLQLIPFFLEEKRQGHIKKFGLSIQCDHNTLKNLLDLNCWDIIQLPLNYFDWFVNDAQTNYDLIKSKNIPIIAQAPMKMGLLSSFLNPKYDSAKIALDFLKELKLEVILCGNSTLKTFKITVNNFQNPIEEAPLNIIQQEIENWKKTHEIKCYNCGRCTSACPQHIPLHAMFKLYNEALKNRQSYFDYITINSALGSPATRCIHCGECERSCPAKLPIQSILYNNLFMIGV